MSLLTTNESVPSRIRGLFAYLLPQKTGIHRDELIATLSPPSVTENKAYARRTLDEAEALGLVDVGPDGLVTLGTALAPGERDQDNLARTVHALPRVITRLAFAQKKSSSNDSLGIAIAWILTKSPLEPPLSWDLADRDLIRIASGNGGALDIQGNNARFGNLCHWITYLGFARDDGNGATALVADPTVAIRTALETALPTKDRTPLIAVITKLASMLPVIDGGEYNLRFLHDYPNATQSLNGKLSPALSMALLRLNDEKTIKLTHEADALEPRRLFVGGSEYTFSSIQRAN